MRWIAFTLLLGAMAFAQTNPPTQPGHNHSHTLIDGAKNPELIADLTAYRLFFETSGQLPTASPADVSRQRGIAHFKLHLDAEDMETFIAVTNDFRVRFEKIVADHNKLADAAMAAKAGPPDDKIGPKIEALTAETVGTLQKKLSSDGAKRLADTVQAEKAHMQIATN